MTEHNDVSIMELLARTQAAYAALPEDERRRLLNKQVEDYGRHMYPEIFSSPAEMRERIDELSRLLAGAIFPDVVANAHYTEREHLLTAMDRVRLAQARADAAYCADEYEWWRRGLRVYRVKNAFLSMGADDVGLDWWVARQTKEKLLKMYERLRARVEDESS